MHYSFDSDGKQFRKKYVPAEGSEQKYVYEFRDEQNVAVELPTKAVSHTKTDHLGRKVFDELQLGKGTMNRRFSYYAGEITAAHEQNDKRKSDPETTLVKEIVFDNGRTIQYEYDNEERITKVTDSVDGTYEYTYDAQGQLLTEKKNNAAVNTMTYDKYGNILTKNGKSYTYDATWKDLLKQVGTGNNTTIEYDGQGNPTKYFGITLTWEKGRQLKTYGSNTYAYNKDGIRIEKRENGNIHTYTLDGTNIVKEVVTDTANCPKYTNEYLYNIDGTVCGLKYNGTAYYFYKNLQGDIIAIADDTGTVKATYTYDAWGVCTVASDTSGCNIATINPFRYRGYYYDIETNLYYIQTRYYDSEICRFINGDEPLTVLLESLKTEVCNYYFYSCNSPVNRFDINGYRSWTIYEGYEAVKQIAEMIFTTIQMGLTGAALAKACGAIVALSVITPPLAIVAVLSAIGAVWSYCFVLLNSLFIITAIVYYAQYKRFKCKTYGLFGYYIFIVNKV